MNLWQQYIRPETVADAVTALTSAPGPALPIGGGTDIMLDLHQGRHSPVHTIVDLTGIPEMKILEIRDGRLFIGAGVAISHIALHPLAALYARALTEACDLIGGPQVRNVATLGGNVAHALPAADGTISLMCLDAEAEVAGVAGRRRMPLPELFLGPGKSALKLGDVIVGFYLPLAKPGEASAFKRIMRPQGVALPIINLSVWLSRSGDTSSPHPGPLPQGEGIKQIRIAVGPGGSVPFRARNTEAFLAAKAYSPENFTAALDILLEEIKFRTSAQRATAEYRRHLVGTLLRNTLAAAWERAE